MLELHLCMAERWKDNKKNQQHSSSTLRSNGITNMFKWLSLSICTGFSNDFESGHFCFDTNTYTCRQELSHARRNFQMQNQENQNKHRERETEWETLDATWKTVNEVSHFNVNNWMPISCQNRIFSIDIDAEQTKQNANKFVWMNLTKWKRNIENESVFLLQEKKKSFNSLRISVRLFDSFQKWRLSKMTVVDVHVKFAVACASSKNKKQMRVRRKFLSFVILNTITAQNHTISGLRSVDTGQWFHSFCWSYLCFSFEQSIKMQKNHMKIVEYSICKSNPK